ncbi:MAG: hypothetical protein Q7S52_04585 [bacterium]|nr:hypothetical protein [bacterium]
MNVNKFYYLRGGAERYFFSLTELLTSRGHEVIPFSMQHPQNLSTPYAKYFPSYVEFGQTNMFHVSRFMFHNKFTLNNMDSISSVISIKADNLFKTPTIMNDPIIDLEAPIINDAVIESIVETNDDILFQEEVPLNIPSFAKATQDRPILPEIPTAPTENKIAVVKIMIKSMQNQLDAMLQLINGDTK